VREQVIALANVVATRGVDGGVLANAVAAEALTSVFDCDQSPLQDSRGRNSHHGLAGARTAMTVDGGERAPDAASAPGSSISSADRGGGAAARADH
jgi:hypothetical protein